MDLRIEGSALTSAPRITEDLSFHDDSQELLAGCCSLAYVQDMLESLILTLSGKSSSHSSSFVCASSDLFHFGRLWNSIRSLLPQEQLAQEVLKRRAEISEAKEHWKRKLEPHPIQTEASELLQFGSLKRSELGCGAAYILYDDFNFPCYVIKPVDEDLLCLHNCKCYGNPLLSPNIRVRDDIPLYRSHQTDALVYETALLMGIDPITPETVVGILNDPSFFDLSECLTGDEKQNFIDQAGIPDKEKLCSIQRYAYPSSQLIEVVQTWLDEKLSDDEIESRIDQTSFEEANLLIWTAYDTDAHAGNFLFSRTEDEKYRLIKIDNGLCYPEKNHGLHNFLSFLPNAQRELSDHAKSLIESIPVEKIAERIAFYEMTPALTAFQTRVSILKELVQRKNMTIFELDLRMQALKCDDGEALALSALSREELERTLRKDSHYGTPKCTPYGQDDEAYSNQN